jgi:Flp pilus assembly protein TadD
MSRGCSLAVVAAVLAGSAGLAALVIWWAEGHRAEFQTVFGVGFVVLGAGLTVLRLTAGDEFLRRLFGAPGAAQARRAARGGWVLILLGAAWLGLHYVDRRAEAITAQTRFQAALNRGVTAAKAQDWPAAAEAFSEAIRLDPGSADALHRRGVAYLRLGEFDRAVADLDAAARLAPADAAVVYNRGLAKARLGDDAGALADFTEAIRLKPGLARAYQARGAIHARRGEVAEAEADWRQAVELNPALNKGGGLDL